MHSILVLTVLFCVVFGAPSIRMDDVHEPRIRNFSQIMPEHMLPPQLLTLPSNATSIRSEITDSFSCDGRDYGYYADVENDCQLFHVCLPMRYQDGRSQMFRWSFICPEETVFNQEIFTCTRADESMDCAESPKFYDLNRNFGSAEMETPVTEPSSGLEEYAPYVPAEVPQAIGRIMGARKEQKIE